MNTEAVLIKLGKCNVASGEIEMTRTEQSGPGRTTTGPQLEPEGRRKPVEQEQNGQMTLSSLLIPTE
jgi:hypothetical protein